MMSRWLLASALAAATAAHAAPALDGCPMFPANNVWNTRVDWLPPDAASSTYVGSIGASRNFHMDFGAGLYEGAPIGIPFVTVPGTQPPVPVVFEEPDESDPGPYPIPPDAPVEGGPDATGDRHVLVVDRDLCFLHETFASYPVDGGTSWEAFSGAVFDLASNDLRPSGWTSADAAGLPILPGLARYEEVAAGRIEHALRFTAPTTQRAFIWPARHFASSQTLGSLPPMGLRLRLKAGVSLAGLGPQARVIAQAMKEYGIILADNGSAWFVSGAPDERWDNDDLRTLRTLTGGDFEVVDTAPMMLSVDSGEACQPGDADGDGIPSCLEPGEGRNAAVKDNDLFSVPRLFAMQQYRDFLGREGDPAGVFFWGSHIDIGEHTRAEVIESFFASPEFQGSIAPVARLYFAYFLRIPDYGGLQYWSGQFRGGASLDSIADFFATSAEFLARYGALTNEQFVTLVYDNVLGRAPDAGGLAYWTGRLDSGELTRGGVMLGFSESAEYQALIGNEVYVTMMYVGMLRREPEQAGFDFWVGYMDSGNSGLDLIGGFLGSAEYRQRFLP